MKYRKILLILAIATLSLTACKKEENPAPAEATAIEETTEETEPIIENESITESETETNTTDEIAETTTGTESTTEISEGTPFEEGEYVEPSMQENQEYSEVADAMEQAKKDMLEFYEAGIISKEDYEAAMETLNEGPQLGGIGSEYTPSTSDEAFAQQYEENAAKAREEMSTNGQGDQRTNINYDIDLPEHLKGDFIN